MEDIFDKEKVETIEESKKGFFIFRFFKRIFYRKLDSNQLNKDTASEPVF